MFIDGETGDFYGTNYNYQVADLVLRAFAEYVAPRLIKTKMQKNTFFSSVTFLRFLTFFYFPNVFYCKKRWQSSER